MRVNFKLVHNDSQNVIVESKYLLDIFNYIRLKLNEPRNYNVEEFTGNDLESICSAYYLIENFTEITLPLTLTDIL